MNSHPVCSQTINIESLEQRISALEQKIIEIQTNPISKNPCFDSDGKDFTFAFRFVKPGDTGYIENDGYVEAQVGKSKNLQEYLYSLSFIVYRLGQYINHIQEQCNTIKPLLFDVEDLTVWDIDPDSNTDNVKYKE